MGNQGWAIYYNQNADDVIPGSATNGISVILLSGDFYCFAPEADFQLSPGEKRNIEVDHSRWMIRLSCILHMDRDLNRILPADMAAVIIPHRTMHPY